MAVSEKLYLIVNNQFNNQFDSQSSLKTKLRPISVFDISPPLVFSHLWVLLSSQLYIRNYFHIIIRYIVRLLFYLILTYNWSQNKRPKFGKSTSFLLFFDQTKNSDKFLPNPNIFYK